MNTELQSAIEAYLLERGDWVESWVLCKRFYVTERQLRQVGDQPGLCTLIAISGNGGYKHYSLATDTEWDRYEARETAIHAAALANVNHKKALRQGIVKTIRRPAVTVEKHSGQVLMTDMFSAINRMPA